MNRLFLDIHALQTLPPSNMNRDDTGSPKTAQYGGVTRARVSSQAWKKAMRDYFNETGDAEIGKRTLDIVGYVADAIQRKDESVLREEAINKAKTIIKGAGVKLDNKDKAKALFFIGKKQAENLADAALEGVTDKKEIQKLLKDNPAIDIALFGRMVADDPSLNEDASAQVAHAISTHAVQTEFDFYTAIDDLSPEDNAGAGMLGTIEYNSSTLYRYANVAVHELLKQLGNQEVTIETLKLFVKAFINSLPTGKVNTFANQTLPQAVLVVLRDDRPVNLVTAYEDPVKSKGGYVKPSVEKLFDELKKTDKFVEQPLCELELTSDDFDINTDAKEEDSLGELIEDLGNQLKTYL